MFSIQVAWLPSGTQIFGRMSSGADTEVRAPATLGLGPANADLQTVVQRGGQRGLRSRRPVSGSTDGCPRLGAHWVFANAGGLAAPGDQVRPIPAQRWLTRRFAVQKGPRGAVSPRLSLYHSQSKRIEWSSRGSGTASRNPGRPHGPCVRGAAGLRLARGISHPHQTPSALCVVAIHRSGLFPAQVKAAFNPSVRSPVEARTLRIAALLFESGVVHRFGCRDWCPAKTRLPGHPLSASPLTMLLSPTPSPMNSMHIRTNSAHQTFSNPPLGPQIRTDLEVPRHRQVGSTQPTSVHKPQNPQSCADLNISFTRSGEI